MADATGLLQELGFGDYEARAYVALLQHNPVNGYELAKASGIPRPNVYAVLQKLEERGAVMRSETPAGARYAPVPPAELMRRLGRRVQDRLQTAQGVLEALASPSEQTHIWNIGGYSALLEHARSLVAATRERLLIALFPAEAAELAGPLAEAEARGVGVTTLCLAGCPTPCGGCRGQIHAYRGVPEPATRWLVLVPDGAEVLAGEIGPRDETLAVRTPQRLLVELVSDYIRNSIALAAVLRDLGARLGGLLAPQTYAILDRLDAGASSVGWLQQMRRLLSRVPAQPDPDATDA